MELRHLRYFVAVAEKGSLTNAAEHRLHTAQPSLSRQTRDLELEIGVKLLERKPRGTALTPAGAGISRSCAAGLDADRSGLRSCTWHRTAQETGICHWLLAGTGSNLDVRVATDFARRDARCRDYAYDE